VGLEAADFAQELSKAREKTPTACRRKPKMLRLTDHAGDRLSGVAKAGGMGACPFPRHSWKFAFVSGLWG